MALIVLASVNSGAVSIDGTTYQTRNATVVLDADAQTLTFTDATATIIIDAAGYADLSIDPAGIVPFASYADMAAWVNEYMYFTGHTLNSGTISSVAVDGVLYACAAMAGGLLLYAENAITGSKISLRWPADNDRYIWKDVLYSDIYADGSDTAFADYASLIIWCGNYLFANNGH